MDFKIPCATWIKEEDEKVLTLLQKADRWLTAEELAESTGLSVSRVTRTLTLLKKQMALQKGREDFLKEL
ncbi:MAG: winged helix-turn-helix transcriptional regulator [Clostridia bacterium]|nr:winged helix-turn-helix transcriptional regulator [Clostridia bacterium]